MTKSNFVKYLLGTIVLSSILLFILSFLLPTGKYADLSIYSILFFTILSIGTYMFGQWAIKNKMSQAFIRIVMLNVFTKLLGSFAFMFIYYELKSPGDQFFLLPFIVVYFVFLIFETYFLNVQARNSKI